MSTPASSRGAALMALAGIGAVSDPGAVPPPVGRRWQPDPRRHAVYQAALARQLEYYDRLFGRSSIRFAEEGHALRQPEART